MDTPKIGLFQSFSVEQANQLYFTKLQIPFWISFFQPCYIVPFLYSKEYKSLTQRRKELILMVTHNAEKVGYTNLGSIVTSNKYNEKVILFFVSIKE